VEHRPIVVAPQAQLNTHSVLLQKMHKANKKMTKMGKKMKCAAWFFCIFGIVQVISSLVFLGMVAAHPRRAEKHTGQHPGKLAGMLVGKMIVFSILSCMCRSVIKMVNKKCPKESKKALRKAKCLIGLLVTFFIIFGIHAVVKKIHHGKHGHHGKGHHERPDHDEPRPEDRDENRPPHEGPRPFGKPTHEKPEYRQNGRHTKPRDGRPPIPEFEVDPMFNMPPQEEFNFEDYAIEEPYNNNEEQTGFISSWEYTFSFSFDPQDPEEIPSEVDYDEIEGDATVSEDNGRSLRKKDGERHGKKDTKDRKRGNHGEREEEDENREENHQERRNRHEEKENQDKKRCRKGEKEGKRGHHGEEGLEGRSEEGKEGKHGKHHKKGKHCGMISAIILLIVTLIFKRKITQFKSHADTHYAMKK
jgi:hypothetical protein